MWHVYNLISEGDEVRAKTDRKVHSTSSTGTTTSFRVQLALTIVVKRVGLGWGGAIGIGRGG
jgi:protein pelota